MDIDFEHKEETVLKAIKMQEDFYKSIGMPVSLRELGVKKEDLETLALKCSRGKTRTLAGYKPLAYEDMVAIFNMAY